MAERRYTEQEVSEIFQRASEAQAGTRVPLASRQGMTLGDLQEIGREVGLPSDLIASAARSLDRTGVAGTRQFLGLPLGVSRVVHLDRRLSDSEWERLVVDLRQTFDARGKLGQEGAFRQWTNGNLQALLEPVGDAHQLRLRTTHGGARGYLTGGLLLMGVAALLALAPLAGLMDAGSAWQRVLWPGVTGAVMFLVGAVRLPGWASTRRRQMQEIAERVQSAP